MTKQAQQLSLFDDQPIEEKPAEVKPTEVKPVEQEPAIEEVEPIVEKEEEPVLFEEEPVIEEKEEPIVEEPAPAPAPAPSSRIAIVILNWNGATMLEHYLPGILEHSKGAEVIVADNASTDDSVKMLERDFPDVRVIALSRNWGYAGGYNQAFKVIETTNEREGKPSPEYYLLLNSDVRVEEGWLEPLVEYMDQHQEVAACQPKILSDVFPTRFEYAGACGGFLDKYGYPYCRGRIFNTIETDEGQYNNVQEVLWASGACMMIRSQDYWNAGTLDRKFFAHQEEIDLCWRLNILGRKVVCIPQSKVYHLGGGTLPKGNPVKTYLNFRNNLTMLYKNLPESEMNHVMKVRLWLDCVAALKELFTGRFGDFKAIIRARKDFQKRKAEYAPVRRQIQELRQSNQDQHVSQFSILQSYYLQRKKTFDKL